MSGEKINDGGPAFPSSVPTDTWVTGAHGQAVPVVERLAGMSLRDWFAGQVVGYMARILITADPKVLNDAANRENFAGYIDDYIAWKSYRISDAMLKAREVRS